MALKILKEKRFREMILLSFVALGLLIACYFVFGNKDGFVEPNKQVAMSQTESKLCSILSAIDGVGEIIAYVNEDAEGEILGAVLVFEGADSLSVRMDVLRATARALGISQNDVSIYKKNP